VPLVTSTLVGKVFSRAMQSEDAARTELHAVAPQLGDFSLRRWSSGRRRRSWEKNCVALGAAALQLEPLAGAELHFAQLGLVTLIELLPLDARSTVESVEYDRVMEEHAFALRDFTLAHYRVGAAPSGDFWRAMRSAPLPERLAHRLDLFAANGRLVMHDFESFEELDWAWLLLGAGERPDALELQIRQRMDKLSASEFTPVREKVRQLAASMPRHIDFLKRVANAQPRGA
jgi:tryptophan halogenase